MARRLGQLALVLCVALGGAHLALGGVYSYQVLFDTDNNSATGCSVPVQDSIINTTFPGVETLVTATVNRTPAAGMVTGITSQHCVSGSTFDSAQTVSAGGWAVGTGIGSGSGDVIEGMVPLVTLGNPTVVRVAYTAAGAGSSDVLLSTTGALAGPSILFSPVPAIPALSATGILVCAVLSLGVVWWAGRRRVTPQRAAVLVVLAVAGVAATALALTIVMDGQVGDWNPLPAVATGPAGDSVLRDPYADLVAGFMTQDATNLYFRFDVSGTACVGKPDGTTCDAGLGSSHVFTCSSGTCGPCVADLSAAPRFVDNGNGTITDRQTCLVWEKKDDAGGIHDWNNGPNWNNALTVFIAGLNSGGFAGHQDWRLPSEDGWNPPYTGPKELESILAAQYPNCSISPCVDAVFDTNCGYFVRGHDGNVGCTVDGAGGTQECSCAYPGPYWSASTVSGNPTTAWSVSFYNGNQYSNTKTGGNFVRAVRGGS